MKDIFVNIPKVIELENSNKWKESIFFIEQYLLENGLEENILLRLLLQCWYVINVIYSIDDYNTSDYNDISKKYIYYMNLYLSNENNNCNCDLLLGYILSTISIPFEPYEQWEQLGLDLISKAYQKNSKSPIFQKIYFGSKLYNYNNFEYKNLHAEIESTFLNDSAIEKYFREILW